MNPRGRRRRRRCLRTCLKTKNSSWVEGVRFRDPFDGKTGAGSSFLEGPKPLRRPERSPPPPKGNLYAPPTTDIFGVFWTSARDRLFGSTGARWAQKVPPESCTSGHLSRALFNQAPSSRFSNTFSSNARGAITVAIGSRSSRRNVLSNFKVELEL